MKTFPEPDCIWDLKAGLGEGLVWIDAEQALYGVDIVGRSIHRIVPATGRTASWHAPSRPTFLVPVEGALDGSLLCGHEDGLRLFDPATGAFGPLHPIESLLPDNRLNDAAIDPDGRLWFGTMHDPEDEASGSLYCMTSLAPAEPRLMDGGYVVSNGPAIDPVRRRLYHNDTALRRIYAFELGQDGTLSGKRIFATLTHGFPDGMAVDTEGTLWVALYAGGGIQRFTPDGALAGFISMPCDNITKIVFGDSDYRTAYVCSARKGVSDAALAAQPLAGGLFRFRVDVPGLPTHSFKPGTFR